MTAVKAWRLRPMVECARCHRDRPHAGRGLCHSCHVLTGLDGTRDNYPRTLRRGEDVVEDYVFLREQGADDREIADRLGMHVDELRVMVRRERVSSPPNPKGLRS